MNQPIVKAVFDSTRTIYRGQAQTDWALQSLWERRFFRLQRVGEPYSVQRSENDEVYRKTLQYQLDSFKTTAIKVDPSFDVLSDDEWWGVGRHHGLWTPLLDWTFDPYIAAYFAFRNSADIGKDRPVAVWAFPLANYFWDDSYLVCGDWARDPHSQRQQAQKGFFTRLSSPIFTDIENYVKNCDPRFSSSPYPLLAKIELSYSEAHSGLMDLADRGIDERTLLLANGINRQLEQLDAIASACNANLFSFLPSQVRHRSSARAQAGS